MTISPDAEVLARIDELAAASREHPEDPAAQAELWRAVFGLEMLFFIPLGGPDEPAPLTVPLPEGPAVTAFTSPERAHAGGLALGLSEAEIPRVLATPTPAAIEWLAGMVADGAALVVFDHPAQGYTAPLEHLLPMLDWVQHS